MNLVYCNLGPTGKKIRSIQPKQKNPKRKDHHLSPRTRIKGAAALISRDTVSVSHELKAAAPYNIFKCPTPPAPAPTPAPPLLNKRGCLAVATTVYMPSCGGYKPGPAKIYANNF
jgi:hypothetical protein